MTRVPAGRRPKMVDVGRLAGVSAQTVSRYFAGTGYVGTETRLRIEAAVEELGYRFNRAARSLRVNATDSIGVLTTGPPLHGSASLLAGLSQAAEAAGYALLTTQLGGAPDDPSTPTAIHRALERFVSAPVDGLVVTSPYFGIEDQLEHVWENVPVVILSGSAWPNADSAMVDSHAAGLLATSHLVDLGHSAILHLAGPEDRIEAHERERGYRDVLERAGLQGMPLLRGDWSAASGHAAAASVDPDTFTAVFSGNDQMALGFMSAMRSRGLVAPADYSIVGVDDMPDARYFAPSLTTVYMDFVTLGRVGFDMIIERIRTGERMARRVIEPELVVRESTRRLSASRPGGDGRS